MASEKDTSLTFCVANMFMIKLDLIKLQNNKIQS